MPGAAIRPPCAPPSSSTRKAFCAPWSIIRCSNVRSIDEFLRTGCRRLQTSNKNKVADCRRTEARRALLSFPPPPKPQKPPMPARAKALNTPTVLPKSPLNRHESGASAPDLPRLALADSLEHRRQALAATDTHWSQAIGATPARSILAQHGSGSARRSRRPDGKRKPEP